MQSIFSRIGALALFGFTLVFFGSAHAATMPASHTLVCKKRSPEVYRAFYRTELITNADNEVRFEYGIGDSTQTYELYFFGPVTKISDTQYESADGVSPRVSIEIRSQRKKKVLSFSVTGPKGQTARRDGYVCE